MRVMLLERSLAMLEVSWSSEENLGTDKPDVHRSNFGKFLLALTHWQGGTDVIKTKRRKDLCRIESNRVPKI